MSVILVVVFFGQIVVGRGFIVGRVSAVVIIAGVSQYAAFSAAEALIRDPALVRNAAAICLDADGRVVCRGGRGRVPGP